MPKGTDNSKKYSENWDYSLTNTADSSANNADVLNKKMFSIKRAGGGGCIEWRWGRFTVEAVAEIFSSQSPDTLLTNFNMTMQICRFDFT